MSLSSPIAAHPTHNLLVELFVEELPPKALQKLGSAFASVLLQQLQALGLAHVDSVLTPFASPRRLAAHMTGVAARAADKAQSVKLMPVSVGLDAAGNPTPALTKRLGAMGVDVANADALKAAVNGLKRQPDGKAEALFYENMATGATLADGLQKALLEAIAKLPIPKVMSYQLQDNCELPGWSSVSFVRPAHGLVALHGADVVPVQALGLQAGRSTQGHRFEAAVCPVQLPHADSYADALRTDGAVIASFAERRTSIAQQLATAAAQVGGGCRPIDDDALLDEVTALVERPHVLVCQFEPEFLAVPQECLILTMKANQKYFPLLDAAGKLTNQFLVVSNINPVDASAVVGGNERVVRPRLADAKFFFDQDRKKTLASRLDGLSKVVYHNKLGTQHERMQRVQAIATALATQLADAGWIQSEHIAQVDTAAQLAKTDLLTDMVGEFPELQGIMGGYYARHDGHSEDVALAIEDHYKPRFAGDELPRSPVGVVVALADKLETLVGMFAIGNLPTGDKDPFALRHHALGMVRLLVEKQLPLSVVDVIHIGITQPHWPHLPELRTADTQSDAVRKLATALQDFIDDRLAGSLREQGYTAQEVDAVLALQPQVLSDIAPRLAAVRAFATLPEAPALAAANKRVGNILKKAEGEVLAQVNPALLQEAAEMALNAALAEVVPRADAAFAAGDYTAHLQALAALRAPVDAFFNDVMVNADDPALKANRLGLLKTLHNAMNRVAELGKLAA
jgi:glycyl-tRNA synthetase beta chain